MSVDCFGRPALLFLPASRASAIARARRSQADLVVLDLEDAVRAEDKAAARAAAVDAVAEPWSMPVAIRINAGNADDVAAVAKSNADLVVLPKCEGGIDDLGVRTGKPVLAMVETPRAVLGLARLIEAEALAGLIAGTNDLAAELRLPPGAGRDSLAFALQSILLAARARGIPAWDGVCNRLDDPAALAAEATHGRALGFDGKSLIHPDQIEPVKRTFAPLPEEIARAERLLAAATGGASRFEGAMIEDLHVAAARRLLDRR